MQYKETNEMGLNEDIELIYKFKLIFYFPLNFFPSTFPFYFLSNFEVPKGAKINLRKRK